MILDSERLKLVFATNVRWSQWATIAVFVGLLGDILVIFLFSKDKPRLETWLAFACTLTIAVGVYGEYSCGARAALAAGQLQILSDQSVAESNRKADAARGDAEIARRDGQKLKLDAAELGNVNLRLQIDLKKLHAQLTPRRLSSAQKAEIASKLGEFKGLRGHLRREQENSEVRDISDDIVGALNEGAQWQIVVGGLNALESRAAPGITVEVLYAATRGSVTAARTLVKLLRNDGLSVIGPGLSGLARRGNTPAEPKANQIEIKIGRKP